MQKHGLYGGSLEGSKRLPDAQIDLRRFVVPGLTTVDFRMNNELRGSPNLAEACLRGTWSVRTVVTGSVDVPVAAAIECFQKGLDIFRAIKVCNPGILTTVADLSSSGEIQSAAAGRTYILCGYRE